MSAAELLTPSRAQAALAIAVIRAKPLGLSVRDYILQLRRQIKRSLSPHEVDQGCHLDLVAYWQEQYYRMQTECDVLRSENIKLERSNQLLTSLAGQAQDGNNKAAQAPKRKAQMASTVRVSKRLKASQPKIPEQSTNETQEAIEEDLEFLDGLGEDGVSLTEALFVTHKLCRTANPDAESLCYSLVHISKTLGKVIRLVALKYEQLSRQSQQSAGPASLDQDKSNFTLAMTVCARAFMSVLVGVNRMGTLSQDQRLSHLIVCELASSFNVALFAIESAARQTAQLEINRTRKSQKGREVKVVNESAPARALAHLLIAFLGFLDKNDRTHQQLFDSFVYLLLERVGQRLFYCTFKRHRSSKPDHDLEPLPEPMDQIEASKREMEALGTRFEVKALVLVLERAMGLAPGHMNPQSSRSNRRTTISRNLSLRNLPTASRVRLSPSIKDRLQRTLITCMYGDKGDDEFLDVLTKPVPSTRLGPLQKVKKVEDKDVEDWYKKEVWRLVGWDILTKESGW